MRRYFLMCAILLGCSDGQGEAVGAGGQSGEPVGIAGQAAESGGAAGQGGDSVGGSAQDAGCVFVRPDGAVNWFPPAVRVLSDGTLEC